MDHRDRDTPRQREKTARGELEWRARVERAAELTRERTGVPVEPLPVLGGLWVSLEAVEAWLGIEQPASPPLMPEQREAPEDNGSGDWKGGPIG